MGDSMTYASFWRRAGALIADVLLLSAPFFLLNRVVFPISPLAAGALIIFGNLLGLLYTILLHGARGQTLGKMLTGIKIVTLDGNDIGYYRAVLRDSVNICLIAINIVAVVIMLSSWGGVDWHSLGIREQMRILAERRPLYGPWTAAYTVWMWSEIIVMLFNEKRRALHDFIAGTVVVRLQKMRA